MKNVYFVHVAATTYSIVIYNLLYEYVTYSL